MCEDVYSCTLNSTSGAGAWQILPLTCSEGSCGTDGEPKGAYYYKRTLLTGFVTSPNHPGLYPHKLDNVTNRIRVDEGLVMILQFLVFKTEKGFDYVTITDGDGTPLLGKSSGNALPATVVSRTNRVDIKFRTDTSNQYAGWNISWSAQPAGLSSSLLSDEDFVPFLNAKASLATTLPL